MNRRHSSTIRPSIPSCRHAFRRFGFSLALLGLALMPAMAQEGGGQMDFPDLVGGLKAVEGCLGVETARTDGGKQVIFAWFENKEAVMGWYYSEMHQGVMQNFFPAGVSGGGGSDKPMEGVPDGIPIMAVASITMSDEAQFAQTKLPISQIAIELYAPVTGGIFLGGRFAPEGLEVADMKELKVPAGER